MFNAITHSSVFVLDQDEALDFYVNKLGLEVAADNDLGFILTTDDCRGTFERLKAQGVEFTDEPTEHFYGIDCGVRDPFGNNLRITQPAANPSEPRPGEFAQPS